MRLFMKKASDSAGLIFTVSDDRGIELYRVTGYKGTTCEKFSISTCDGVSLVRMRLIPLSVFYAFGVRANGKTAIVTVSNTGGSPEFKFHGLDWYMKDDCFGRNFRIYDKQDKLIMSQRDSALDSHGYFEIEITDSQKELLCVAAAVCIDLLGSVSETLAASI